MPSVLSKIKNIGSGVSRVFHSVNSTVIGHPSFLVFIVFVFIVFAIADAVLIMYFISGSNQGS